MSLIVILLLLGPVSLWAEVIQLEEIAVTATKEVSDFSFSHTRTIPLHEIENQSMGVLPAALDDEPSLTANQNGGPGGRVSYFLRGTESRHLAFTLDGLKINDPSNTDRQFDAAFFTLPFLREVQIHKGPQAVLYGSDSIGGLIELSTRKGEEAPQLRLGIRTGSFRTSESHLSGDWKNGKSRGTMTVNRFFSDGISRLNTKRFGASEADSSEVTQLSSSSQHAWNPGFSTDLLFSYLRGSNELDGARDDNSFDESTNDHYIAQQKSEFRLSKKNALSLRNGVSRHQRWISTLARGEEAYSGNLIQNELLYRHQGEHLQLLSGLASEHENFNLSGIRERSFDLHSLFVQTAIPWHRLRFQAGTRLEEHTRYGTFYTGSTGLGWQFQHSLLSFQFSRGFKAPSLYQLHGPFANADLVPEINQSWEGGWRYLGDDSEFSLVLFQNRLSNLITYDFLDQRYFNQGRFIAEGIEVSGKQRWEHLEFKTSYTHQQFRKQQESVLRRPGNSLNSSIAFYPSDVSEVSLKGRWFSSRKDFGTTGRVKLNGFETLDLETRYFFSRWDLDVAMKILNLTDRQYEELFGYSVLPRSIFVSSAIRF